MNVEMSVLCEPPSFPFPEVSEPAVAPTRPAPRPPVAGFRRKAIAIPATTAEMPAVVVRTKAISSFAQELMWLLDQMAAEKAAYNVPRFLQITGPLNIAALEWALNGLVGRHEALRTTFTWADGHLEQVILPVAQAAVTIDVVDLRSFSHPDRAGEVRRILKAASRRPFNLSKDVLQRATVLRLDESEYALLLSTHHIASDGWSKGIFYKELGALYGAFLNGQPSPLAPLAVQYADFAEAQRARYDDGPLQKQLEYWKSHLTGAPERMELPTDHPRPAVQSFRGARLEMRVPKDLTDAMSAFARAERATLFMVGLAAFNGFLSRYCGQTDLCVGTPIAGRTRPEFEGLIGYFSNTLVLRNDVSGDPTFRTLLRRVRSVSLAAYENQELPLEKLVVELKPRRDPSYSPLFQVLFTLQAPLSYLPELQGLTVRGQMIDSEASKFDLGLYLNVRPDGLAGMVEYSTDLFDHSTIERLQKSYVAFLRGVTTDPDRPISTVSLLEESDRRQILTEWNATVVRVEPSATVIKLFEARVEETPDAVAAAAGSDRLSYRQLNVRADALADRLCRLGVGPDILVGVFVDRSLEMAVAYLGVLKAGGAFVPLDPSYPVDRLHYMIEDTRAPVLLTTTRLAGILAVTGVEVICLDTDMPPVAGPAPTVIAAGPDDAAYVIYTSGSTGKPRGVVVSNRGMVNHSLAAIDLYGLRPDDRVLQFSSVSFDISIEEMFPAWVCGAAVVLRTDDMPLAGRPFLRWLDDYAITALDLPTAFWHEWTQDVKGLKAALPARLRILIVGGERAALETLHEWLKLPGADSVRWYNTYGPTETTVIATAFGPISNPASLEGLHEIPIGRPIANTRTYILDNNLEPVPVGIVGELFIGGAGVARGYLNRPDATAERFGPDPFSPVPGAICFRTGDLVRYRPDGAIEFVARADQQVKVRGFRVEPGEIEAVLQTYPSVRECTVVVRQDDRGEKMLVAYVTVAEPSEGFGRLLLKYLGERLPSYMLPSAVVVLDRMPLTPNGKIDRTALPAGATKDEVKGGPPEGPADALEAQLLLLWEEVLGKRPIGVRDNFFEIGGHSLMAARLLARVETVLGISLPLRILFQAQTVSELADILRTDSADRDWPVLVPVQPLGEKCPIYCVAKPGANALGYAFLGRRIGTDRPLFVLQSHFREEGNVPFSREEFDGLADQYTAAVIATQPKGPYILAGNCEGAHIAFAMARQLQAAGREVSHLIIFDAWPLENTRSYLRWNVFRTRHLFRRFLRQGRRQQLCSMWNGLSRKIRQRIRVPAAGRPAKKPSNLASYIDRYWPGPDFVPPKFEGKITLFRVPEQPYWRIRDANLGWNSWTTEGVEVHDILGQHRTFLREPHVHSLAEKLTASLTRDEKHADGLR